MKKFCVHLKREANDCLPSTVTSHKKLVYETVDNHLKWLLPLYFSAIISFHISRYFWLIASELFSISDFFSRETSG